MMMMMIIASSPEPLTLILLVLSSIKFLKSINRSIDRSINRLINLLALDHINPNQQRKTKFDGSCQSVYLLFVGKLSEGGLDRVAVAHQHKTDHLLP